MVLLPGKMVLHVIVVMNKYKKRKIKAKKVGKHIPKPLTKKQRMKTADATKKMLDEYRDMLRRQID